MHEINIERYVVSDKLYNQILDVLADIHVDIRAQTDVGDTVATQLTAQILNRIAYQIHQLGTMPTKKGNGSVQTDID
jgi:hypothetical protein